MPPVIYSTNVFLKLHIQERFRGDIHYAWCSDNFDSRMQNRYSPGALVAPSSNPADIYRELKRDVDGRDVHSAKISEQKNSLKALSIEWASKGEITPDEKDEIFFMADNSAFEYWRPLIYIIPRNLVAARLEIVPIGKRAGFGIEYIIKDLKRDEFDVIEMLT